MAQEAKKYFYGLGRRKAAIAQVRLYEKGTGDITINDKTFVDYLPHAIWQQIVLDPLVETNLREEFDISVKVVGGGFKGQAESIRLGITRALLEYNTALRGPLKAKGFLTRDPRVKERKKPGLKRARRAPQWSKR